MGALECGWGGKLEPCLPSQPFYMEPIMEPFVT